ncbi:hypothetical protein [Parasegetibacter sp. NRK P23]|uniref:hypothetical protein n=1 Tax=Parasegetibacter sp. NRK P23 TaxID=2942999 RepID=UPI002044493B|nr:hypothetical protein [Parasegetibacter sp. NRK P23]MCM5530313.1 hypothetical protein [Parasegetibacter sp. NRK P23]
MASENNEQPKTEVKAETKVKKATKKVARKTGASTKKKAAPKKAVKKSTSPTALSNFPRHSIEKALRIPKAILDQNAGKECTDQESATYVGVTYNNGPYASEISSSLKYGLLERPAPKKIKLTELAKKILRPQTSEDELTGYREAVLKAPVISDVYKHYRGENLPDRKFFDNALTETFKVPEEKHSEFTDVFSESLTTAKLLEKNGEKTRVIDISSSSSSLVDSNSELKKLGKAVAISDTDTCFVMQPFASPLGDYYSKIYDPAIRKAGLNPIRADQDIFGTGKIIDQIWSGINSAKVLIAELTKRNANVFYELGLAHALKKPVVLVSSNQEDVPFDLQHIRVIYYDVTDPFWGNKLIDKVAENILSAIKNPEEAILFREL